MAYLILKGITMSNLIKGISDMPIGTRVIYLIEGHEPQQGVFMGIDTKMRMLKIDGEYINTLYLILIKPV